MQITTAQVARSVGIGPRSKRFVLRDEGGPLPERGLVLLCRADRAADEADLNEIAPVRRPDHKFPAVNGGSLE